MQPHGKPLTTLAAAVLLVAFTAGFTASAPNPLPSATQYGSAVLPPVADVTSWDTLARVTMRQEAGKMVPQFDRQILALDGKDVKLHGFMLPLDVGKAQRHFLISAAPPSCPFCLPAGPEAIVEVFARDPVAYSLEPIVVNGKLTIVKADPSGLLYRLNQAELLTGR